MDIDGSDAIWRPAEGQPRGVAGGRGGGLLGAAVRGQVVGSGTAEEGPTSRLESQIAVGFARRLLVFFGQQLWVYVCVLVFRLSYCVLIRALIAILLSSSQEELETRFSLFCLCV